MARARREAAPPLDLHERTEIDAGRQRRPFRARRQGRPRAGRCGGSPRPSCRGSASARWRLLRRRPPAVRGRRRAPRARRVRRRGRARARPGQRDRLDVGGDGPVSAAMSRQGRASAARGMVASRRRSTAPSRRHRAAPSCRGPVAAAGRGAAGEDGVARRLQALHQRAVRLDDPPSAAAAQVSTL